MIFGSRNQTTVEGVPAAAGSRFALAKGLIIGMVCVAALFLIISRFEHSRFQKRFLAAFSENQRESVRISKEEFSPIFGQLMNDIYTVQNGGEAAEIFTRMDTVLLLSEKISATADSGIASFPYADFSKDENRKIGNYFTILKEVDNGRHAYLLSLKDCVNMTVDAKSDAGSFCNRINTDWDKRAKALMQSLVDSLELSGKDKRLFEKGITG